MDIEKEIKFLEFLDEIPMPPDPAPIPNIVNGMVKVPIIIKEYFEKIKVKLEMDQEGQMKVADYSQLVEDYHIPTYGIKMVAYVTVDAKEVRKNRSLK